MLEQCNIRAQSVDTIGAGRADALQELEPIAICISGAEAGIAESATVIVRGGAGRPRLASLLAPAYIAVLRRSQIARGLGEALGTFGHAMARGCLMTPAHWRRSVGQAGRPILN